jgi:hypothetical protein
MRLEYFLYALALQLASKLLFPFWLCYTEIMTFFFNPAAFKHSVTERDIEAAMATALIDELIEGYDNKYLVVGFDMNSNFIEVMYNLVSEDIVNVFHAMKCRKEFLQKLQERGFYADFN